MQMPGRQGQPSWTITHALNQIPASLSERLLLLLSPLPIPTGAGMLWPLAEDQWCWQHPNSLSPLLLLLLLPPTLQTIASGCR
jgi:hypothetical protein